MVAAMVDGTVALMDDEPVASKVASKVGWMAEKMDGSVVAVKVQ